MKALTAQQLGVLLDMQREALKSFCKSKAGADSIELLKIKYGGDVHKPGDPYATHLRIGERNVVDYLISLREEK